MACRLSRPDSITRRFMRAEYRPQNSAVCCFHYTKLSRRAQRAPANIWSGAKSFAVMCGDKWIRGAEAKQCARYFAARYKIHLSEDMVSSHVRSHCARVLFACILHYWAEWRAHGCMLRSMNAARKIYMVSLMRANFTLQFQINYAELIAKQLIDLLLARVGIIWEAANPTWWGWFDFRKTLQSKPLEIYTMKVLY